MSAACAPARARAISVTADLVASPAHYVVARRWLDALIERELLRLQARAELSLDLQQGLRVTDADVDSLLRERLAAGAGAGPAAALGEAARELHAEFAGRTPLAALGEALGLSGVELDLVFLALAPELDLAYAARYATLNGDAARRHLTVDLAARLLRAGRSDGDAGAFMLCSLLGPRARLLCEGVLEPLPAAPGTPALACACAAAPLVVQALLGLPLADPRWPREVGWMATADQADPEVAAGGAHDVHLLCGDEPAALRSRAMQLATARGWRLLQVGATALASDPALGAGLRLAAQLAGAALVLEIAGAESAETAARAVRDAAHAGIPALLLASDRAGAAGLLADVPHHRTDVQALSAATRALCWSRALADAGIAADSKLVAHLAANFPLGEGRIEAVARSVALGPPQDDVGSALGREASARSNDALAGLATRLVRGHGWDDLVLADNALLQLHEVAQAVASRDTVYRGWGLVERTGRSTGLMIFFTGAPGTGKTMAASVVANAAGLELYRIDLAGVVSKYIGETERNLERIFACARRSSAVLLFDEADALLGRRSEIKDAHDRYANIEVAYLLQKMEDHDGVVILASNLAKNLDPAFARRMHYLIEFARPNAVLRERLWRGMYPARAPLADDVDFRYLAERFETTGGEIQAIALDAAFLAASAGTPIGMAHLMRAMTRRQTKQGNPGGLERYREHREAVAAIAGQRRTG